MKRIATITLAALTTLSVTTASAASFASASLRNFTFSLVDLDLDDGITPSLGWYDNPWIRVTGSALDYGHPTNHGMNSGFHEFLPQPDGTTSGVASTLMSHASASGSAGSELSSLSYMANGSSFNGRYESNVESLFNFVVTGKARVTFSADANFNLFGANAYTNIGPGYFIPYSNIPGSFVESPINVSGDSTQLYTVIDPTTGQNIFQNEHKLLTFSFDSLSPYLQGGISVNLGVAGSSGSLTPVPEPETYAMLLAGLGLVGFSARRKKS